MPIKQKAQALALTIFIILVSLGTVILILMPINQQVIRIRKILNMFQVLNNAETGIEVSNYYAIKGGQINDFNYTTSTQNYSESNCKLFVEIMENRGFRTYGSHSNFCNEIKLNKIDNSINSLIYYTEFVSFPQIYPYTKVISTGKFKDIERVLDFDFWPF